MKKSSNRFYFIKIGVVAKLLNSGFMYKHTHRLRISQGVQKEENT